MFTKGNKAAANPANKAVAEMIRQRLEKDGKDLSDEGFAALVSEFNTLTVKRRRRRRNKPEREKSFFDKLPPDEAEMWKTLLQIEAERGVQSSIGVCQILGIRFTPEPRALTLAVCSATRSDAF